MTVKVLFFGITRDIIGKNMLDLEFSEGISIQEFKQRLANEYPSLNDYQYAVAVNEAYANDAFNLQHNDTVALIPPVSGG